VVKSEPVSTAAQVIVSSQLTSPPSPESKISSSSVPPKSFSPQKARHLNVNIPDPTPQDLQVSPSLLTPTPPTTPNLTEEDKKKRQVNKALIAPLMKVWRAISQHRFASVFKNPVSLEEAPDYDDIIKRRMDLSTIKKRLEEGITTTSMEFHRDLILMFQNAMIYNPKDSDVYMMAVTLKKFAAKEMESVFETEQLLKSPHPTTRSRGSDKKAAKPLPMKRSFDEMKIEDSIATPTSTPELEDKKSTTPRTRKALQEKEVQQPVVRKWKRQRRADPEKSDGDGDD